MTWATRFKLVFGVLGVLVIVAALTYVYTERESNATSASAAITAQTLPVGTDYGGKIVEQFVEEGDHVEAGDALFTIDSLQRQLDLEARAAAAALAASNEAAADGAEPPSSTSASSAVALDAQEGQRPEEELSPLWTVTASASGTIADVPTGVGGYVPAGGVVAHLFEQGSLHVRADFLLTPRDFDRLQVGAPVELRLPDRSTIAGTVDRVEVATEEGAARAFVRVESPDMIDREPVGLTAPGTPVNVKVELRDDGPLAGLRDSAEDFLERIGL
ncbi:MAG: HlyD family efflux transporter periplasmic adaptor subunit [Demequina sp.]